MLCRSLGFCRCEVKLACSGEALTLVCKSAWLVQCGSVSYGWIFLIIFNGYVFYNFLDKINYTYKMFVHVRNTHTI